ncbi:MAG: lytic transglycosylase [Flavobacteriales bacterium]|nr:lytic transglycosylase [Flavobacteriales bacterium]
MRFFCYIYFILLMSIANADNRLVITDTVSLEIDKPLNIYEERLELLNINSPMDLSYNEKVEPIIESYLGKNKNLISRMQGVKDLYFPLFEQQLDKYELPLELKYLAIVESALNPKARSGSGATGLWQFMYLTGKQYGLQVTSYMDERQDPYKATEAACVYFCKLYDLFGDWNLVLAAYNGGPGYLQKKINSVGSYNFWELYPHLRKETRNYIPTFIAVNYVMNYSDKHGILIQSPEINVGEIDTLTLKKQVEIKTLMEILCVNKATINYLNPSYKKEIYPKGSVLVLPFFAVNDFLNNEESNYIFIDAVDNKEILIDEDRIVYSVQKGDYLGRIAKEYGVHVYEIKQWNNLRTTDLDIGDKLVVYVKKNLKLETEASQQLKNEYVIQKGDTLWGIAQKYKGLSVWKIKSLNNLESDNLKPGTKIILPTT